VVLPMMYWAKVKGRANKCWLPGQWNICDSGSDKYKVCGCCVESTCKHKRMRCCQRIIVISSTRGCDSCFHLASRAPSPSNRESPLSKPKSPALIAELNYAIVPKREQPLSPDRALFHNNTYCSVRSSSRSQQSNIVSLATS